MCPVHYWLFLQRHPSGPHVTETLQTGRAEVLTLGSKTEVGGREVAPTVALPHPHWFESGFVKRHWHSLNTSIGEEPSALTKGTPISYQQRARPADVLSVCLKEALQPELLATSLLFLFIFACQTDRRGKRRNDVWLHVTPLSHVATVLRM